MSAFDLHSLACPTCIIVYIFLSFLFKANIQKHWRYQATKFGRSLSNHLLRENSASNRRSEFMSLDKRSVA